MLTFMPARIIISLANFSNFIKSGDLLAKVFTSQIAKYFGSLKL